MHSGAVRRAGRYLGLTVAAGVSTAAGAQQARTGLLVSTGLSAETNPFSDAQSRGGSAAVTAELQPIATWRSDQSSLDIRGLAQFRQFFRRYGLEDNYGADANYVTRASERVTLRAAVGGQYNEGGFGGFGRPGLSPGFGIGIPPGAPLPGEPVADPVIADPTMPIPTLPNTGVPGQLPLLNDVTVLGQRVRTTALYARVGVDARISARSQVGVDFDARASRFAGNALSDYNSARAEARLSRQVSDLTSIGVIGSFERVDYRASRAGDSDILTGLLSYDRRFSERWELSLGVGVSDARISQLPGIPNARLTSLSVQGRFCYAAQTSRLCVSGSRSPQPSAIGGVRVSETISVNYGRRLSEREGLSLGGSYSRTGEGRGATFPQGDISFVSGSARYDNRLGERTVFFASGSASKINGALAPRRANFGVTAGLQFRFGAFK